MRVGLLAVLLWMSGTEAARAQLSQLDPFPVPRGPTSPEAGGEDEAEMEELVGRSLLRRHPWLLVQSDSVVFHTSNVYLQPELGFTDPVEDRLVIQTATVIIAAPPWQGFSGSGFARHQTAFYDENEAADFHSQTVGLLVSYSVEDWFTLTSGFAANRQLERRSDNTFFDMYDVQFGLWRSQPICSQAALVIGYQFDWRPSSPARLTRADNVFFAGLSLRPWRALAAELGYRIGMREYLNSSRSDLQHLFSATVTWTIRDWVQLHWFLNYTDNDSNTFGRDYTVFDAGGGLKLSARF